MSWDRQAVDAMIDALRDEGVETICGPNQVHAKVGARTYQARFGRGLTYRPDPINAPLAWVPADPQLAVVAGGLESSAGDGIVALPATADGAFVVTSREFGAFAQTFVGANASPVEQIDALSVVYRDVYANVDLRLTVNSRGWKADWIFKAAGHPRRIDVQVTAPWALELVDGVVFSRPSAAVGAPDFELKPLFWTYGEEQRVAGVALRAGNVVRYTLPTMSDVAFPFVFDPSTTFNPDASPETTTVDGHVTRASVDETFSTIRSGAGTGFSDSATSVEINLTGSTTTDQFSTLRRGYFLFDTSSLAGSVVNDADLRLYVSAIATGLGSPSYDVVPAAPASNTALASADYALAKFTTGTLYASVASGSLTASAYNTWNVGAAAVDEAGITKLGMMLSWDRTGTFGGSWASSFTSSIQVHAADGTNAPELSVTYQTRVLTDGAVSGEDIDTVWKSSFAGDGVVAGDTAVYATAEVVTDGAVSGEDLDTVWKSSFSGDGAVSGDDAAFAGPAGRSVTDGAVSGEDFTITVANNEGAEGALSGDSPLGSWASTNSASDGAVSGDVAASPGDAVTRIDGALAGELLTLALGISISDGAVAGDGAQPLPGIGTRVSEGAISGDSVFADSGTLRDGAVAGDSASYGPSGVWSPQGPLTPNWSTQSTGSSVWTEQITDDSTWSPQ